MERLPKVINYSTEDKIISIARSYRDKAMIKLLVNTGLRVSELVNLKVTDIDMNDEVINVIGKRDKQRIVPLNQETILYLVKYLENKKVRSNYVFSSINGTKLRRQTINHILKMLSNKAGVEHIHPHMLRHTFCTRLCEKQNNLHFIAELAGHSKIDTTRIYTKVTTSKKKEVVSTLDKKRNIFFDIFIKNKKKILRSYLPISKSVLNNGYVPEIQSDVIRKINQNINLKIHTLLFSPEGYGKSSVLNYIKSQYPNVIYSNFLVNKADLFDLFEQLFNKGFYKDDSDFNSLKRRLSKLSINNIIETIDIDKAKDYIMIFDDITDLTRKNKKTFYKLSNYFTIITATEKKHENILDKFDKIELKLLSRKDTIILINSCININEINDEKFLLSVYDTIFTRSQGFPRAIIEMTDKIKKNNMSLFSLNSDNYVNTAHQKSIFWLLLLIIFTTFAFVLKFSLNGFAGAAIVYILLMVVRTFLYKSFKFK